jgi:hypothetical protein
MLTKVLVIYSSALTTVLTAFVLAGSVTAKTPSFDEIDVRRINVREPDGTLRLVISNRARLPGVIERGNEHPKVDRPQAGVLFYNDEGTENGGLVFGGHRNARGGVTDSGGMLTFDRYAGSQIIQLAGVHDSMNHIVGLIVSDTDDRRNRRVFVGHDKEGVARVALMDGSGRPRIMLQVTSDGNPSLSFLDSNGNVVNQVGPTRPQ